MSIIQWNCRGLRSNYEELKSLVCDNNHSVVCLHETFLKDQNHITFKGYDIYNKTLLSHDNKPIGGVSLIIKRGIPHQTLNITTSLQVVACTLSLHKIFTIASIYIPPKYKLSNNDLNNIISQLPSPFLLCGDFNAHSEIWGC